ncbi:diacylglycerol kinase [Neorhizobium sp. JUb45]|nr:diacylglycerol kinase [Neorhizobium sp. JUb45]
MPRMEKTPLDSNIEKASGLRRVIAATRYSLQGLTRLWQEEAFRHEVIAFVMAIVVFVAIGAHLADYLIYLVLMLLLFAVEALNTAIEELVDRISPEISTVGRHAKDLGSLAVFCLLCANGVFVVYVVVVRLWG